MKKVIVTGANGFIGSSLINKLVDNNISVVAIDISFKNSRLPESNLITEIESNLSDEEELLNSIPKDEYLAFYHFAWRGVNGPDKADPQVQLQNTEITLRCASVAKKLNVHKFLCAGTVAERSIESLSSLQHTSGGMMYGAAKQATHLLLETYCKNIDLDFVWMQFSNIYGPNNKTGNLISYTIDCLNNDTEATFGPALQPYDFIYVEDLITAIYKLGTTNTKGNCYFIGSGEPRILKDYLLEVGQQMNKEDLIQIGVREDDGIKYSFEMFDTKELKNAIGDYTSMSFSEAIKYTIDKMKGGGQLVSSYSYSKTRRQ